MKTMIKLGLAVLAVGVLIAGAEGVALADHNRPNLGTTGQPGNAPDYNYPMDTTQPGWSHGIQGGGYVGYPPDYSNAPDNNGWTPKGADGTGVSAAPQTSQAAPAVPVAPFLGNDQRSSHSS
jgi:hypothetical protein